jgi:hypothetical protein
VFQSRTSVGCGEEEEFEEGGVEMLDAARTVVVGEVVLKRTLRRGRDTRRRMVLGEESDDRRGAAVDVL